MKDTNIEIKFLDGEPAARTAINHPFVNIVKEAASKSMVEQLLTCPQQDRTDTTFTIF